MIFIMGVSESFSLSEGKILVLDSKDLMNFPHRQYYGYVLEENHSLFLNPNFFLVFVQRVMD